VHDVDDPAPGAGQVLVDVELAGVMFGDVIVRSGRWPMPLPWTPGIEVGGRVAAVGPGGDEGLVGKTVVATTVGQSGGYAERALTTAAYTFPVPDGLPLETALTVFQARSPSKTVAARIIGNGTGANSRAVFVDRGSGIVNR